MLFIKKEYELLLVEKWYYNNIINFSNIQNIL